MKISFIRQDREKKTLSFYQRIFILIGKLHILFIQLRYNIATIVVFCLVGWGGGGGGLFLFLFCSVLFCFLSFFVLLCFVLFFVFFYFVLFCFCFFVFFCTTRNRSLSLQMTSSNIKTIFHRIKFQFPVFSKYARNIPIERNNIAEPSISNFTSLVLSSVPA